MIIDASHFTKGELLVEGIVYPPANEAQMAISDNIESFIHIYEKRYIKKMLGRSVSLEFIEYLKSKEDGNFVEVNKWEDLIALFSGDDIEVSPIACYVYYHFVRSNQQRVTSIGTVETNNDNPLTSAEYKLATAWNLMVGINVYIIDWIDRNERKYPEWDFDVELITPINQFNL